MKKFAIVFLIIFVLSSTLVFEASACNVSLTTSRNYRDLDSSYT